MNEKFARSAFFRADALVLCLAAAKLAFHLLLATRYGIFRDELYYLACGEHLDWGYVDHPPVIALIAWIARHIFGDWLPGLRLFPALAGAATVWLTGKLTGEMGGGPFARVLAALAVVSVPLYLIIDHWLTMNAFEPLLWIGCVWCIVRAIKQDDRRYWIPFGIFAGVAMETKYTVAFFVFALVIGLILTRHRRFLAAREFWIGAAIALLIFVPNLIWLYRHDFPFLQLMHNVRSSHRDVVRGPVAFILDQAQIMNPVLFPLWAGGLIWLFVGREAARFRVLGIIYLCLLAMFIVLRGKNYYLNAIYPVLFAAGAIALEQLPKWRWIRPIYVALVVISIAVLASTVSPILSPEHFIAYENRLGIEPPRAENQPTGPLPQYFADEFGWEEMARETARVYNSLSPAERAQTAIFANNYGEAGAIDFFGPRLGLPKAICNHQSYWLWGPRHYDGRIVIVLGSDGEGDRRHFQTVEVVGHVAHPYSRRDEHFDIFLCRGFTGGNLRQAWSQIKSYN